MLARNEIIFKWVLYAMAAALCLFLQGAVFQRLAIWGVIPFVYPLLAAIPATYERAVAGTVFALAVGVVCDLLLPGPIPCFYTLIFPLAGLSGSLMAQSLLPAGYLCSLVAAAAAFFMVDLFHCLLLAMQGKLVWGTWAWLSLWELCVSLPLALPATWLFRAVYRKTHFDD